jgi:hypothetical protein
MRHYSSRFSTRYALWRAYDMKCFYCGQPVDFMNMNVDHILPNFLSDDSKLLKNILRDYEIAENFPDFSIDGLSNLVPSHGASCNLRKSDIIFPKRATLFYLTLVHEKLPRVVNELERLRTTAERGEVLGKLGTMLESGNVSEREVVRILRVWEFRRTLNEPLIVTFGLNFGETLEMRGLIVTEPSGYAIICDQMESELVDLLRSTTTHSFHYPEASARNGETLSVRLVFPEFGIDGITSLRVERIEQLMPWWEILEVSNFYRIYGSKYEEVTAQLQDKPA